MSTDPDAPDAAEPGPAPSAAPAPPPVAGHCPALDAARPLPASGRILVLAAMPEEAAPLESRLDGAEELPVPFVGGVRAVAGTLHEREVVVVTTGIGVAAATAAATWGIIATTPRLVVGAGTAGGLAADVEVGTVVIGDSFTYSIADATAFGYAPGQVPGGPERFTADRELVEAATGAAQQSASGTAPVRTGLMLSGDAFVTAALAEPMRERFPGALSTDMESTGIARTAAALGVPFVAIRAISDLCGPSADQQFHLAVDVVADFSARAVDALIAALPAPSTR